MTRAITLDILVSHPIQYFAPVYRELAKASAIDFQVMYRTRVGADAYHDAEFGQTLQWDISLLDGYPYLFLSRKRSLAGVEFNIIGEVLRRRRDVLLVHGYNSFTNLLAMLSAKQAGTKVLIRGDTRLQPHHESAPLKRVLKRFIFRLVDGFVCIGTLNRDYYAAHGVPKGRLFFAPFSVDNRAFAMSAEERLAVRYRMRSALSVDHEAVCVLSASKLIPLKRVDDLIRAFASIQQRFPEAWLIVAGSGGQADELEELAGSLGVARIRFAGFLNQSAIPGLYAASDLFVLPSASDAWGLSVNEAMAAGLPVIVSDQVGASPDLVKGKKTGFVYPCGDVAALSQALAHLLESLELRRALGRNAERLISDWDADVCAKQIVEAARAVCNRR